jgi:thymidylate kinase
MGERVDDAYLRAFAASRRPITMIEFIGLPGSGKTAIARKLLALLREDRPMVTFSRDKMGIDLPLMGRSLRRLALVLPVILRAPMKMCLASLRLTPERAFGKDALKTRWNFCSVLAMHVRRPRNGLLIADEAVGQAIWTARVHHGRDAAPADRLFHRLHDWIGETLFIHVDAPVGVAQQRLAGRSQQSSRFQNGDRINDVELWARGEECMERVVREIGEELDRRNLHGRLLRIASDGDDTPLDRAKYIRDYLLRS